jgi:quercetin dioxygenase-like cupin family protein
MTLMSQKFLEWAGAAAVGVVTVLVAPGVASATPPDPRVVGTTLWQRTVGETKVTLREIRLPPGADTGWHYHDGPLYARVLAGTLNHFDSSCASDGVYPAGRRLSEPSGADHVHIGRNLGRVGLVLEVLYVLPAGSPFAEDAANPGCDFE